MTAVDATYSRAFRVLRVCVAAVLTLIGCYSVLGFGRLSHPRSLYERVRDSADPNFSVMLVVGNRGFVFPNRLLHWPWPVPSPNLEVPCRRPHRATYRVDGCVEQGGVIAYPDIPVALNVKDKTRVAFVSPLQLIVDNPSDTRTRTLGLGLPGKTASREAKFDLPGFQAWQSPPLQRRASEMPLFRRLASESLIYVRPAGEMPRIVLCGFQTYDLSQWRKARCSANYPLNFAHDDAASSTFFITFEFPGADISQVSEIARSLAQEIEPRIASLNFYSR